MKFLIRIAIGLVIIVIAALVVLMLNLNTIIKSGVETGGPLVMKVPVNLEKSDISLFSGSGALKGLTIHNPAGYDSKYLFHMDLIGLSLDAKTLFSDRIHINNITIDGPHIIYEGLQQSNLKTLMENMESGTASDTSTQTPPSDDSTSGEQDPDQAEKKIIIDHLVISNVKVGFSSKLLQGKSLDIVIPTLELRDIGKEKGGATPKEVVQEILLKVYRSVEPAIKEAILKAGGGADQLKDAIKNGDLDDKVKSSIDKGLNKLFGK